MYALGASATLLALDGEPSSAQQPTDATPAPRRAATHVRADRSIPTTGKEVADEGRRGYVRLDYERFRAASGLVTVARDVSVRLDPPHPVLMRPFYDGNHWMLGEALSYKVGTSAETLQIPAGFVTDLASVPQVFWTCFPRTGTYQLAAIVHDYLYWAQPCTKDQADNLFHIAMSELGVAPRKKFAVFQAVRQRGQDAWDMNASERGENVMRIIPLEQRAVPANVSWPRYRAQLAARGIRSDPPAVTVSPGFCALGNTRRVPT